MNVTVIDLKGDSFNFFDTSPTDQILSLKQRIRYTVGFNLEQIRLIYAGKTLDQHLTLEDYKFSDGGTLHLLLRQPAYSISVKALGKSQLLEGADNETVNDLLEKLTIVTGKDISSLTLLYGGVELEPDRNQGDYNLSLLASNGEELELRAPFDLHVTFPGGKLTFTVDQDTKVATVKSDIFNEYKLFYQGKELQDEVALREYGIYDETTVQAHEGNKDSLSLEVKTLGGALYSVEVSLKSRVKDVKDKLKERILPGFTQLLYYKGALLYDNEFLESWNIGNEEVLHLVLRLEE
mmetsp:Transcript_18986/g.34448  ORF Transcript_18986/g.34448 Transcript_18986/m.34448 type:complete len:294 (+) Transcript_18986:192-1073(+)